MGGYAVRDVNLHAWGVDLIEEHALNSMQIPIRPYIPEKPLAYIAECGLSAPYSGTINSDGQLDFIREDKRVLQVNYIRTKGTVVVGPEDGLPNWIVEIVVKGNVSVQDTNDVIRDIVLNKAVPPITPAVPGSEKPFTFPDHGFPFIDVEQKLLGDCQYIRQLTLN